MNKKSEKLTFQNLSTSQKSNIVFIVIAVISIIIFGFIYNESVTSLIEKEYREEKDLLSRVSSTVVGELTTSDIDQWKNIIEIYNPIYIKITDGDNNIIVENQANNKNSILGKRLRSVFIFEDKAYMITLSTDPTQNIGSSIKRLISVEIIIFAVIIFSISFLIYRIFLKPFRKFYQSIEEYDSTGNFKRQKMRGRIGMVYERFARMANNLSKNQTNRQRIIAAISHDIKTPLTSIMGYSERLIESELPKERRDKYLGIIYSKSRELKAIVDDFDEYLDNKLKSSISLERYTLDECKKMLLSAFADELASSGITFSVSVKRGNKTVMLDVYKMHRVFENLISNSIKHLDKIERKISIEIYPKNDNIIFKVSDNGEGVEPEKLDLIFEPLYTSDKGRKVAGLGLSICRETIEKHGGKIYAESVLGEGFDVFIEFREAD